MTSKFTIKIGSRSYNFNIPSKDFLAYLNKDFDKLDLESSIEIPDFIDLYLKKSYSHFLLLKEFEKLSSENENLKNNLNKQEEELQKILNKLSKAEK